MRAPQKIVTSQLQILLPTQLWVNQNARIIWVNEKLGFAWVVTSRSFALIALAIHAVTINLCLVYIETTVCLITNYCFNEWKAHISKHLYRNFDNLFIRNKNWLRAQKFVSNSLQLVSMYILIRACNNDSFLSFETLPANERGKVFCVTSNVDWLRLRNKMTQGRIAVKGNRGFCPAWQKAVGIFEVLVITKFSNFLQRPNSIFCRSANRFSFLSMFIILQSIRHCG